VIIKINNVVAATVLQILTNVLQTRAAVHTPV